VQPRIRTVLVPLLLAACASAGAVEDLPLPAEKVSITIPYAARLLTCEAAVVGEVVSADATGGTLVLQVERAVRGKVEPGRLTIKVSPAEHAKPLNKPGTELTAFIRRKGEGDGWVLDGTAARGGAVIWKDTELVGKMLEALKDPEKGLASAARGTRGAAAYYLAVLHAMRKDLEKPQLELNTSGGLRVGGGPGDVVVVKPPPEWAPLLAKDRELRIAGAMRPLIETLDSGRGRNVNAAGRDGIPHLVQGMNLNRDRRFKYSVYLPKEDKDAAAVKIKDWWNLVEKAVRDERGDEPPTKAALPGEERARIAALIVQLGAERWQEREAAQAELAKIKVKAYDLLREATRHPDPEVARRADLLTEVEATAQGTAPLTIEDEAERLGWLVPRKKPAPALPEAGE